MEVRKLADRSDFFDNRDRKSQQRRKLPWPVINREDSGLRMVQRMRWRRNEADEVTMGGETRASQGLKDLDGWCAAVIDSCD